MRIIYNTLLGQSRFVKPAVSAGLLVFICAAAAMSTELMSPATQLGHKKFHAEVYYRHLAKQDMIFEVTQSRAIQVQGSTISSNSTSELESEGSGNGMMARISFEPMDNGLRYYVLGGLSTYDLKIPSGAFSNTYATDNSGFVFGGGLKYTLAPFTMVTPAFSADLSAVHSRYRLTRFTSGDGKSAGATSFLFTTLELQAALTVSRKFMFDLGGTRASIDPYFGVKIIHLRSGLDDLSSGASFSGTKTGYAPFFGFKFKPFPFEGLVIEGSVLNEYSASIGLTLGF